LRVVFGLDGPIFFHTNHSARQRGQRVGQHASALGDVARRTGVEQVVVVGDQRGMKRHGQEVVDVKDASDQSPLFAYEAVDAAKIEFVAQPRSEARVIRVALRTVPTCGWPGWVLEGSSHVSVGN